MKNVAASARTAIRRSAEADGGIVVTRSGREVSVGRGGHFKGSEITATVHTRRLRSSAEARNVVRAWWQRREWYPDEHPFRALDRAIVFHRAARWQATKRARGRRMRR